MDPEQLAVGHDKPPHWWERRRARSVGAGIVTVAALAGVGVGAADLLVGDRVSTHRPDTSSSPQPLPPIDVMALRAQTMNGFREVGFDSVSLIVPSYWGRNAVTDCGVLYADMVLYPGGPGLTRSCGSVLSGRHSYVAFDRRSCAQASRLQRDPDLTRRLDQRVAASGIQRRHNVYEMQVELVSTPSCITLSSPYRPVVERLAGTLRPARPPPPLGSLEPP